LSEFNVLVDDYGPVIIDLPQAVDAAANNHAAAMLRRDIENMTQYYALFAPELLETRYAEEIWHIYKEGKLTPDTPLSGEFQDAEESSDVDGVLAEIQAVLKEEEWRQARQAEDL
jgi:RIO kinase 1